MRTQIRLSINATRQRLGFEKQTGTLKNNESLLNGLYCGGRKIIHAEVRRGGKVKQTRRGFAVETFTDGFGIRIDAELEGEKPIIKVKDWRQNCTEVQGCYKPNLPWRFMGVAINWLQPHESGALLATDQNGHHLYVHAFDQALIDD